MREFSFHVRAWVLHKRNEDMMIFGTGFVREDDNFFGGLEYISPSRVWVEPNGLAVIE